jgi:hypothetical protein
MSKEGEDYYIENGYRVLTEKFLVNRGWCCSNGCRHCPYSPQYIKGSTELKEDVKKRLTENKK